MNELLADQLQGSRSEAEIGRERLAVYRRSTACDGGEQPAA